MTRELIIDSFAGGGGASTGIEMALGRSPDIAINHDDVALAMHAANHPQTRHLPHNIWKVDPLQATGGAPVGLLWCSPDCKHFSKAKGGRPVEQGIRDLAWVVVRWARQVRPRVIMLENVEEFATWGPLGPDGRPCPDRKGATFRRWIAELRGFGYQVEHRELRACDYGAPTIRKRLFLIARRDGLPIVWPAPTHADPKSDAVQSGRLRPWRTAAEIIDWSLPCPSIFLDKTEVKALFRELGIRVQRPLRPKTMERIAKGIFRYVINAARPFIVPITHGGGPRVNPIDEPVRTQTTAHRGEHALVTPFLARTAHGDVDASGHRRGQGAHTLEEPIGAVTSSNDHAVVAPFITKFNGRSIGHPAEEPLHTITSAHSETHPGGSSPLGIVAPFLAPRYQEKDGHDPRTRSVDAPTATQVPGGNEGVLVAPYLTPRYGERDGQEPRTRPVTEPMPVIVPTANEASLIAPVLVGCGGRAAQSAPRSPGDPLNTATAKEDACLIAAHLSRQFGASIGSSCDEPAGTITAGGGGKTAIVAAFLAQNNYMEPGHDAREPLSTIVNKGSTQSVVSAGLVNLKGTDRRGSCIEDPAPAVTAQGRHLAEVRAFLVKYHGAGGQHASCRDPAPTIDTHDRIGIVTVAGVEYQIVDIGMRMLTARERFNAQGFSPDYIITLDVPRWVEKLKTTVMAKITGDQQGRMVGNSVSPPLAAALVAANCSDLGVMREAAE
jgi:DNA (cytosine-5)-methyltransferase 1